jgi:hypothetical protein
MQISPRRRHRGVPERGLHEMDRCAAVEAVRGMGVSEPVRRDLAREPYLSCRRLHDPMDRARIERPAFPRQEHGLIGRSCRQLGDLILAQRGQHLPSSG